MSPAVLFSFVIGYFLLLMAVAWYTSRGADNESFFIGNRNSRWWLVAFGMVGTTLSGVTLVSVPGTVGLEGFSYLQIVIGNVIGFVFVAYVLLPIYYKLNLTSIYTYLQQRLGFFSYKTGASFFILSRTLGATARLYLVIKILHTAILQNFGISFLATTIIILAMILAYTYEGGVKTIVYTDTLQTTCILLGLIISIGYILSSLNMGLGEGFAAMQEKGFTQVWGMDPAGKNFFVKQIFAGALITITMVGMDQEMMQKNISVKTLKDSQRNMLTFSGVFFVGNFLFLFLGGLLYLFAGAKGISASGDALFPTVALQHMPAALSIIFIIALISAMFPSADGAITALTSSTCIDLLGMNRRSDWNSSQRNKIRKGIHIGFAFIFLAFVMVFEWISSPVMINVILKIAGYTYGPLLGLFAFGILTRRNVNDRYVLIVALIAPLLCFLLDQYQDRLFDSFRIGLELLFINGLITFAGLWLISRKAGSTAVQV